GRRRGSALDAEVVIEAETVDEDDDGNDHDGGGGFEEDDDWTTDRQRARRGRRGEVVDYAPEDSNFRPLRNAAASPADLRGGDNKFRGRRPGQAVNGRRGGGPGGFDEFEEFAGRAIVDAGGRGNAAIMEDGDVTGPPPMPPPMPPLPRDGRERHVLVDEMDYMSEFLPPPIPPRGTSGAADAPSRLGLHAGGGGPHRVHGGAGTAATGGRAAVHPGVRRAGDHGEVQGGWR
ncbi:hypothetical protein THAOC_08954, partial [Thalassiosira oceanica]